LATSPRLQATMSKTATSEISNEAVNLSLFIFLFSKSFSAWGLVFKYIVDLNHRRLDLQLQ